MVAVNKWKIASKLFFWQGSALLGKTSDLSFLVPQAAIRTLPLEFIIILELIY